MTTKTRTRCKTPLKFVVIRVPKRHPNYLHACECIAQSVKKGYSVQVFLHGPAVDRDLMEGGDRLSSLAEEAGVAVHLCQAAWQRLQQTQSLASDPPYPLMSLIATWDAIERAEAVCIFGFGQWPAHWPSITVGEVDQQTPRAYGVMVAYPPSAADRDSLVEWVLAGATLDLDLVVAFAGEGASEVEGEAARRWAQISDHGLAEVMTDASIIKAHSAEDPLAKDGRHPGLENRHWLVM